MKKSILLLYTSLASMYLVAQPNYPPTPVPAASLSQLEYFIDRDPGVGNGRSVTIPAGTDLVSFNFQADLSGIASGFHRIYLRSREQNGAWSMTNNFFFDNFALPVYPAAQAPLQNLVQAEYYIDTDPGFGNAIAIPLTVITDLVNQQLAINISGLTPGIHRVYVRTKDADGKWSLINFGQFDNTAIVPYPSAPAPAPALDEMEYYIDTDPGFGNGTDVTFAAGTDITNLSINVSLASITPGPHVFYIRSRQNPWSLSAYIPFLYSSTLPVTWLYVKGEIRDDRALITWATAQEEETDKFMVEHSTNAQVFNTVGEVAAAENSNSSQRYSFNHAGLAAGMNYYRLKQLDKNGKFTYSKTIQLLYKPDQQQTMVAPNPVSNTLYLIVGTSVVLKKMELFDLAGKLILTRQFGARQQVYSIDVSSLLHGSYIVKLYDEKGTSSHQLLKQ
jgi:hypothetical protein